MDASQAGGRTPLLVLAVLALVAIAIFGLGVAGTGRTPGGDPWPEWATPEFAAGNRLTMDDLRGSDACRFDEPSIRFLGLCQVEVSEVTGGWPWQSATRRAILTVAAGPVAVRVTLAGKELRADLDPGDRLRLTYTREGGAMSLGCASPTGCVVVLSEDL